jgi:hypothetical protein
MPATHELGYLIFLKNLKTGKGMKHLIPHLQLNIASAILSCLISKAKMVVGEGFEPSKSVTADLQSAPFGRSGTPPDF